MMIDVNDGEMIFRDLGGPRASRHLSYRWGKPRKNLTQKTCPDRGSNPGPLREWRAWYHLAHSGGHTHINVLYPHYRPWRSTVNVGIAMTLGIGREACPTPGRLFLKESHVAHITGDWVAPRTSLNTKEWRKNHHSSAAWDRTLVSSR